tara:strand:+ start:8527 stop:9441 length:915 start_codon:yes stop_codon:yes gene_type:complete
MKCDECSGIEFYVDDRMGETICKGCGYVQVTHIFEDKQQRVLTEDYDGARNSYLTEADTANTMGSWIGDDNVSNKRLSSQLKRTQTRYRDKKNVSMQKGLLECNMVLSPFLPNNPLRDRVHDYYRKLYLDHKFRGIPIPLRACALVVLCLRESGIPITISELAAKNNEDSHKVSKCARHFARYLGKSNILQNMPLDAWVERIGSDLKSERVFIQDARTVVSYVNEVVTKHDIHFSKSHMASALWMTTLLRKIGKVEHTQQSICDACQCTAVAQRITSKKLFPMLGVDKDKLLLLDVESFCAGIR